METWALVMQEEPGAQSCGMTRGSEPLEPCRLAFPLPNDPLGGTRARSALKIWHGLVHQVQSHLMQVLIPLKMAGSALGLPHVFGCGSLGPSEEPPHPGLT